MMNKVVIISSGQPSANPRAVKEALALDRHGYEVIFIYCPLSPWADVYDKKLFAGNQRIQWISKGAHPVRDKWKYIFARARKKIYEKLNKGIRSLVLFSQELTQEALKHEADLYIAHNLGAIEAAVKAAKKYNAKAGFDAEDFHRGEFRENDPQEKTVKTVENKYFPLLDYCSTASPLISAAYSQLFSSVKFTTVNNTFPVQFLAVEKENTEKKGLDLFWFSQFIGPARGLETVIDAMNKCKNKEIRLHLLGNIKEEYRSFLTEKMKEKDSLFFLSPVSPEHIFAISAGFDIGLATEIPDTLNRDYCLTNKIFTYLLAGNGIIMSATSAQKDFASTYPGTAVLYEPHDEDQLSAVITDLYEDRQALQKLKSNARLLAEEKLNWEKESLVFLNLVKNTIKNN